MSETDKELQVIESVADKGGLTKFWAYAKLSGPGWLQGAITLGGGSLAGALFLGVISGYGLLWVQPLAMVCGIIMLSAIAYVTLSTGKRPFGEINRHLHPLLGWSWLVATIMANIVWTMPQFALATAAIQQNLLGGVNFNAGFVTIPLLAIGLFVNYLYEAGGKSAQLFDTIIKIMVAIIVLSFFAVVGSLLFSGQLPLGKILAGYLPDFSLLDKPAAIYDPLIAQSGFADYWREKIVSDQRDVIITAFGTAVGINMTFLLPYSLLKKRWGKRHRDLSITDLSIGLFIPFFLATSCVVIAAASSFHGKVDDVPRADATAALIKYAPAMGLKEVQIEKMKSEGMEGVSPADISLAGMLTKRDAGSLAITLEPFAGKFVAQKIFGVGVLGMAISTIVILMLMNGLAFQEALGRKSKAPENGGIKEDKPFFFLGCCISGLAGVCYPLLWTGGSKAALAVPTSVIGGSLIPIAYFTFFLMMNSRNILGDAMPKGKTRLIWNLLMGFATIMLTMGSVWVLHGKTGADGWKGDIAWGGIAFLLVLFIVGTYSFIKNERRS